MHQIYHFPAKKKNFIHNETVPTKYNDFRNVDICFHKGLENTRYNKKEHRLVSFTFDVSVSPSYKK